MKFGINTCLWTPAPTMAALPGLVRRARAAGADWLELPLFADTEDQSPVDAGALLRDHDMAVSVVTGLWPSEALASEDRAAGERGVASLRTVIERAAALGSRLLSGAFHTSGDKLRWHSPTERAERIDRMSERLSRLAAFAAPYGITLCIEPLNRYEADLLNTTAQALDVVKSIDHPNCSLLLDTFHMNIEEASVGEALRAAGPWLRHLHANESHRGAPGEGRIDWSEVAAALRDVGYDGALVIESFDAADPEVAQGGHAWRPHAASADALASRGIAFLRQAVVV